MPSQSLIFQPDMNKMVDHVEQKKDGHHQLMFESVLELVSQSEVCPNWTSIWGIFGEIFAWRTS